MICENPFIVPIIKSAIKKMKQDVRKTALNRKRKEETKNTIKNFLKAKTNEAYNKAVSSIDKLAKKRVIHKNKAARLKSRLAKQLKK
jgi:small subunit ribosomal protein S20